MNRRRNDDRGTRARFAAALARPELRQPTSPRVAPQSPTSMPVKADDPELRRMIDEAIVRKAGVR